MKTMTKQLQQQQSDEEEDIDEFCCSDVTTSCYLIYVTKMYNKL